MWATSFRWAARGLSIFVVTVWGFFLVASAFGDAARGSRPLTTSDGVSVAAIAASLAGLCAAWKWELAGATVTLAIVMIGTAFNARVLASPAVIIPITAYLFIAAGVAMPTCSRRARWRA